jgi:hypothetical protein
VSINCFKPVSTVLSAVCTCIQFVSAMKILLGKSHACKGLYVQLLLLTLWRLMNRQVMYKNSVLTWQVALSISTVKTRLLMLFREIISICGGHHGKKIYVLCGKMQSFLVTAAGACCCWCTWSSPTCLPPTTASRILSQYLIFQFLKAHLIPQASTSII